MADTPEIPEARDRFEKIVALTIAILAVFLAFVDNTGDNAKTDAIVKTTQAANKWAYFQSKSLKGNLASTSATLLSLLSSADPAATKAKEAAMIQEAARYEEEKKQLMADAQDLEKQAQHSMSIDDRCDLAILLLQIGVVVCSISILVRWKAIFYGGIAVGVAGILIGATAFFM